MDASSDVRHLFADCNCFAVYSDLHTIVCLTTKYRVYLYLHLEDAIKKMSGESTIMVKGNHI